MKSVNIGIDLGTTNSLIAKYENNNIRVYKNPVGQKETLASVVAFRKDRIMVGDKAREYLTKDAVNVFGGFKRKMGTDEKYYVVNLDENVTPIELSTQVLKELKSFVQEPLEACVITIPASFDSMQSNATLKAGNMAGFKDVFLLQEPIAASLAFFNNADSNKINKEGYWLVYDFGGGTFDVALVKSTAEDLKVIDHEGNNFLGGMDLDFALIDKIIVPAIIEQTKFENFEAEFREKYGKYESLFYQVLYYAEEAKKELSYNDSIEIEFSATIEDVDYDFVIPVTRAQVDEIFMPIVNDTIVLLKKVLENNFLDASKINEIILVGGSTFLPQVRSQLVTETNIPINYSVDPTTSVAIGAAYYAANKFYEPTLESTKSEAVSVVDEMLASVDFEPVELQINLAYNKSTRDVEEVLIISCNGDYEKYFYRIIRADGGFDSGITNLKAKKTEFLSLLTSHSNTFTMYVYDEQQNELPKLSQQINITQGIYNIDGQPLPHDICVEVDDVENKSTKLEAIFERNSLLPQKRTLYREISKTIKKGSTDNIIINIMEGDKNSRASSNLTIGCITISGKDLDSDLVKGSDIEIQVHITESRIINTAVFLVMTQQEFKNVFSVSEKQINLSRLKEQFSNLEIELADNIKTFHYNNDDVWEIKASAYMDELDELKEKLFKLKEKDKSDEKYIIAEKITRISQAVDKLGGNERIAQLLEQYLAIKDETDSVINSADFLKDELRKEFIKLEQSEATFLNSKNSSVLEGKLKQLDNLHLRASSNNIGYLIAIFIDYKTYEASFFKDYNAAKSLIRMGDVALESEKYPEFKRHVFAISSLLVRFDFNINSDFKGTGIG